MTSKKTSSWILIKLRFISFDTDTTVTLRFSVKTVAHNHGFFAAQKVLFLDSWLWGKRLHRCGSEHRLFTKKTDLFHIYVRLQEGRYGGSYDL